MNYPPTCTNRPPAVLNLTNRRSAQACGPSHINNIYAGFKSGPVVTISYRAAWRVSFINVGISSYIKQVVVCTVVVLISNPNEEAILASEEGKRMFAAAIARGVTDYILWRYHDGISKNRYP